MTATAFALDRATTLWDPQRYPNMIVSGPDHSGRSRLASIITEQAEAAGWRTVALDGDRGALDILRDLANELMERFQLMSNEGASRYTELKEVPPPILVTADRGDLLVAWNATASMHLGMLARLGKAAGIVLLVTAATDAELPEELDNNVAAHVVLNNTSDQGLFITGEGERNFFSSAL